MENRNYSGGSVSEDGEMVFKDNGKFVSFWN